jgi:hypothetical protein
MQDHHRSQKRSSQRESLEKFKNTENNIPRGGFIASSASVFCGLFWFLSEGQRTEEKGTCCQLKNSEEKFSGSIAEKREETWRVC